MAITAQDYQATALTRPATAAAPPDEGRPEPDPDRIGIVFVHGIGTQQPAETFLDWSKPIVRILTTWRIEHGFSPDPVVKSEFSFSGSSQPYLELDVPAFEDHPARRWVITEAWWAARLRPPNLGDAATYVRHALPQIFAGIRNGYHEAFDKLLPRLEEAERAAALQESTSPAGRTSPIRRELERRRLWAWIDAFDQFQRWMTLLAYVPALVLFTLLLLIYAPFRLIPIKAIQNAAILKTADSFLTEWFGDLPDILEDPVQAANVRARIAESIARLQDNLGCGSIVLIAHSGGAIMSFTTLLDEAYQARRVDRLMTIGEALQLAWRVHRTGTEQAKTLPDRLAGNLASFRKDLRWTDTWASYDPAPAGPLAAPAGVTLPEIDSRPVTNRMSILEDHGAYWENDEGFVIPLVRYLDEARGDPDNSRFYRDPVGRFVRIERRRQRVAALAVWRWLALLGATIPIVASTIAWATSGGAIGGPAGIGAGFAEQFGNAPFHQVITVPLDLVATLATFPGWFVPLGEWLIGAGLIVAIFFAIALVGIRMWSAWDERERAVARREVLTVVDRGDVVAAFALSVLVIVVVAAAALRAGLAPT